MAAGTMSCHWSRVKNGAETLRTSVGPVTAISPSGPGNTTPIPVT